MSPEDIDVLSRALYAIPRHDGHVTFYVPLVGDEKRRRLQVHRIVMDAPASMQVDHVNRDTTDNRRPNLRLCTNAQNQWNKRRATGKLLPKGVHVAHSGRFIASIRTNNHRQHLGTFDRPEDASEAYLAKARELHGEFARTE